MIPAPGVKLELGTWVVGPDSADEYLKAVDDSLPIYAKLDVVPPLALAARALAALLKELSLPPGTLHAAQELHSLGMVRRGEEITCAARLSRPIARGGWQFISAEFTLYRSGGEAAIAGKTTVLVPLVDGKGA